MDNIDTRKHYAVPMTVTCKVEDADEATALCEAVAAFLVQRVKGVSASMPPTVGVPQDVTAAPLSAEDAATFDAMTAEIDQEDAS